MTRIEKVTVLIEIMDNIGRLFDRGLQFFPYIIFMIGLALIGLGLTPIIDPSANLRDGSPFMLSGVVIALLARKMC